MRWSFTLALFVFSELLAISLPSVYALPLPEEFSELVARGKDKELKDSSKAYRDSARKATTSFDKVNGALTQVHHQGPHTPKKGQDADHTHEAQTAHHALGSIGHTFGGLPTPVRNDLKQTFNGPGNMMFVDKSTNRSKGQLTKQALQGPLKSAPSRDDHKAYLPTSNKAATSVAHNMDNILKKHGVQGANNSPFRKTEQKVQQNMGYGSHSGGSTSKSSSHTGTKRK